ncbi:MAG TPA: preprotein translocase subunit SecE [Saprospiraceae bacterium]|nr:preprotein translocase subunit SecE [Saprospiraceae bacterium]HRO09582.1 preprotein translocase subunit SecE [Saprospiraceae bacterium]HRO72936.1 preprotein translocase subunit SecE [Saprospiraceae bacterium]HRP42839.1 preprotein translocase subunit SecE [Saprospiraceae bacterium]
MDNLKLYLKESYDELMNHVTWPTWEELFSSARLIIVSTIILSLIIFIFDFIANRALTFMYEL